MVLRDSTDYIRLDVNNESNNARVYVRNGDTRTRTIHCTLTDNGKIVDLSECILAEILIVRPDSSESANEVVINGNELQYTWRTTDLAVVGESRCQFTLTYSDASVITSPQFSLFVYAKSVGSQPRYGTNEYTTIAQKVALASQYADASAESYANTNTLAEEMSELASECENILDTVTDYYNQVLTIYESLPTQTLVLGIGHEYAGYGDYAYEGYVHSNITEGNPHGTTYEDVGADVSGAAQEAYDNAIAYGNENYADASTVSTLVTDFNDHTDNTTMHTTSEEKTDIAKISTIESDVATAKNDIIAINNSLAKLTFEIVYASINTSKFTGSGGSTTIRLWRLGQLAFGLVYVSCNSDIALRSGYVVVAQINDASFYPSYQQLVRGWYNGAIWGQMRALPTVTIDGTTYNNVIVIGYANTDAASGDTISFPITYICDGD